MDIEDLKKRRKALDISSNKALDNMTDISNESKRVSRLALNSKSALDKLESQFENATALDSMDIQFLFFAIALQCTRQYLLTNNQIRFDKASDADKAINKRVKGALNKTNIKRDYKEILIGGVPYDIIPSKSWATGLSGQNHRENTLGHDPLFGWIFGTVNIMTSSLTKKDMSLSSYNVSGNDIESVSSFPELLSNSFEITNEDRNILIASVAKQAMHYASDAFTKKGLPLPILNNISPNFNSTLVKSNIDLYSVTRGVAISMLINTIISIIHSLYYNESLHLNKDIYEVKTRKIISYSNAISSSSNVIAVALNKDLKKLDVGGLMVTIYRLITDINFIREVKEEFIFGSFNQFIQGKGYTF